MGRIVQVGQRLGTVEIWAGDELIAVHPQGQRAGQHFILPGQWAGLPSTTVALLMPVVTAVVGSDIAGLGPDGVVSTETKPAQNRQGDWPSIQGG